MFIKKNHDKVLKMLKKGANPNIITSYNYPLDIAIHNRDIKMIKILIFYGAILTIEESRLFCNDCRKNFTHIYEIYDIYKKND